MASLIKRQVEGYEVRQVKAVGQLAEEVMVHHPQAVVWNMLPGERNDYDSDFRAPVPIIECSLPSQSWVADNLEVVACLTKPITAQQLLREIERLGNVYDVLVIDDDWGFCQLVERILKTTGRAFAVRRAYEGKDGLQAMRAQRPNLVLLDLMMPEVDGFQVLEEMRREPELADVPVVVLTATSYAEDVLAQRGGQVVLRRPDGLSPAEVLRCLRGMIGLLEPRYDERLMPEEVLTSRPIGVVPPAHQPG